MNVMCVENGELYLGDVVEEWILLFECFGIWVMFYGFM